MIPTIRIGNDFTLNISILSSDGELIDITSATDVRIFATLNGVRLSFFHPRTITIYPEKITLDFSAINTTHAGDYRIIVRYRINDTNYLAECAHAFFLTIDSELTNTTASAIDITCRVQFSANGKDGLSAYELAVNNGYPGTYDEWVKMYAGLRPTRISFIGMSGNILHTIEVATPVEYSTYGSSCACEPVGDWGDATEEELQAKEQANTEEV